MKKRFPAVRSRPLRNSHAASAAEVLAANRSRLAAMDETYAVERPPPRLREADLHARLRALRPGSRHRRHYSPFGALLRTGPRVLAAADEDLRKLDVPKPARTPGTPKRLALTRRLEQLDAPPPYGRDVDAAGRTWTDS